VSVGDATRFYQYLITPELAATTSGKSFSFFCKKSSNSYTERFRVGYSTTTSDLAAFTWGENVSDATTAWKEYSVNIPADAKYVSINYTSAGSYAYLYIDDINISILSDYDAGVSAITTPISGVNLTNQETVTVAIKNFGALPLVGVPVKVAVNGVVKGTETIATEIPFASEITNVQLTTKLDLSAEGAYTIKVYTDLTTDSNHANDTTTVQVTNLICEGLTVPWSEGFNTPITPCWVNTTTGTNETRNFWQLATTGANPTCTPIEGSSMLFFNSYNVSADVKARLVTPPFSTEGDLEFSFYINRWSTGYQDSLNIYLSSTTSVEGLTPIYTVYPKMDKASLFVGTETAPGWYQYRVLLPSIGTAHIILEGVSRYGGNIYVDQLAVSAPAPDATVSAFVKPVAGSSTTLTNEEEVVVKVKNIGTLAATNVPVYYKVGATVIGSAVIPALAAAEEVTITFDQKADLYADGTYTIQAYTALEGDGNVANDTTAITIRKYICEPLTTFPLIESFDTAADPANPLGPCWSYNVNNYNTGQNHSVTPGASWRFYQSMNYLITRELAVTPVDKVVSFYAYASFSENDYDFYVGYSTTGNDFETDFTFNKITMPTLDNDNIATWLGAFETTIPGAAKYVAFRFMLVSGRTQRFFVDDIKIDLAQGVNSSDPEPNATGVALNKTIVLTFAHPLEVATDYLDDVTLKVGNSPKPISLPVINGNTMTIAHTAAWDYATTYTLTVPTTVVPALSANYTLSFTTLELIAIAVSGQTPEAGDTDVALDAAVSVTFDNDVAINGAPDLSGVSILTLDEIGGDTGSEVDGISASVDPENPNKILIAHADFDYYKGIKVTIPAGAVKNYDQPITWSFVTTLAVVNATSTTPEDNAGGVALDAAVSITFDQPVAINAVPVLTGVTIQRTNGAEDTVAGVVASVDSENPNKVNITHADFEYNATYKVSIPEDAILGFAGTDWSFDTPIRDAINEVKASSEVVPTITKGLITVTTPAGAQVKVTDLSGRLLATYQSSGVLPIELNYVNGVYIIVIENEKAVSTHKVVLQK
jgi:hypothetical protein